MKSYEKMVAVNRQTSERKELIAIEAMRKKYESQEQVSVVALVKETGLSRGFFYKNERVRTELRRLQKLQAGMDFTATRKGVLDKAIVLRIKVMELKDLIWHRVYNGSNWVQKFQLKYIYFIISRNPE